MEEIHDSKPVDIYLDEPEEFTHAQQVHIAIVMFIICLLTVTMIVSKVKSLTNVNMSVFLLSCISIIYGFYLSAFYRDNQ